MSIERSRSMERVAIGEAIVKANLREGEGRRFCDELIARSRDVVGASKKHDATGRELRRAISALEDLVGAP